MEMVETIKYKFLFLLFLLFTFSNSEAQNFDFDINNFTSEKVLDYDHLVQDALKDSKGFIWIANAKNLYKYDGYSEKIYQYLPYDTTSLLEPMVFSLYEDKEGAIWAATSNGLCKFSPWQNNERFIRYAIDKTDSLPRKYYFINSICEDFEDNLWLGGNFNNLFKFNKTTGKYTRIDFDKSLDQTRSQEPYPTVLELIIDKKGELWLATVNGLYKYERDEDVFINFKLKDSASDITQNTICSLYESKSGTLWLGTFNGLYTFDRLRNKFIHRFTPVPNAKADSHTNEIWKIVEDKSGNFWLRTFSKIYIYNPSTNKYAFIEVNPEEYCPYDLSVLVVDSTKVVWYSKHYKGLYKLTQKPTIFNVMQNEPGNPNSVRGNNIISAFEDRDGSLWIGAKGLNHYNSKSNTFKVYKHDPNDPNSIAGNFINSIYRDSHGILWISTYGAGLNRLVEEDGETKFIHYRADPLDSTSIRHDNVTYIKETKKGNVIFSTGDVYNREKDNFYNIIAKDFNYYYNNRYWNKELLLEETIKEDELGCTWRGLLRLISPNGESSEDTFQVKQFVYYRHNPLDENSISCNRVQYIFTSEVYEPGTIWVGTHGGGLNKLVYKPIKETNKKLVQFERFTTNDGLPGNYINGILEDGQGNLWIGTDNGISVFDPRSKVFKNYNTNHGLPSNHFYGSAVFKNKNGKMYFGSENGLVSFYPDSIKKTKVIPEIVFTDFKILNKSVLNNKESPLKTNITYSDKIVIPYSKNYFTIEFAALSYIDQSKNQYKYFLEGVEKDTVNSGTKRFAEYKNLKPGKYNFWVTGSNNDGVWNKKGASLEIIITPPWWRTKLARLIYLFAFIAGVSLYIKWRTRSINRARKLLEQKVELRTKQIKRHENEIESQKNLLEDRNKKIIELDQMKTRFFTNVSHEFRTPLTLIQGPVEDLLENKKLPQSTSGKLKIILRNAKRLLMLVNQLLEISKIDSGKLKLEISEGDLVEQVRVITGSFASMAEIKGINFKYNLPVVKKITLYDFDKLYKIISNLLSNAFKFTPEGGEIVLSVQYHSKKKMKIPNGIEISVMDTGIGIPEEKIEKIFDRFYQSDENQKDTGSGTGIGLSLTQELVKMLHGKIAVTSNPGKGTSFTVQLPLGTSHLNKSEYIILNRKKTDWESSQIRFEENDETPNNNLEKGIDAEQLNHPKILVIEDNKDVRNYIVDNLTSDFDLFEAIDGSAGLKKALEIIPDLVITDLMMPRMDGMEFCEKLKNDERTSHIPIIMLTAKGTLDDKLEGYSQGADEYITKPFNMRELKSRITNLLIQRKNLRERFRKEIVLQPENLSITPVDEKFLKRAIQIIELHISDDNFNTTNFGKEMNMSHSTLFRKLHALTNLAPTQFIIMIRLKRAAELIKQKFGNISEVALEVGFSNPSYFSKCFKKIYSVSPFEFQKNN